MVEDPGRAVTSPLLQVLPLLVFVLVDLFVDDVRISIAAAILFAALQLGVTWRRTRRFDWFVVLDVVLIAGLGGVSIALKDELFFKLKPAIVEGVTIVFMVGLLLAPTQFLTRYLERLTPGKPLTPEGLALMRAMLGWGSVATAVHIVAVLYAAFFESKAVWATVSGPGFYAAYAPVMGLLIWRARRAPPSP